MVAAAAAAAAAIVAIHDTTDSLAAFGGSGPRPRWLLVEPTCALGDLGTLTTKSE